MASKEKHIHHSFKKTLLWLSMVWLSRLIGSSSLNATAEIEAASSSPNTAAEPPPPPLTWDAPSVVDLFATPSPVSSNILSTTAHLRSINSPYARLRKWNRDPEIEVQDQSLVEEMQQGPRDWNALESRWVCCIFSGTYQDHLFLLQRVSEMNGWFAFAGEMKCWSCIKRRDASSPNIQLKRCSIALFLIILATRGDEPTVSSMSYGSFTTYNRISAKKGCQDEDAATPVRRSSRIRNNQVTSP